MQYMSNWCIISYKHMSHISQTYVSYLTYVMTTAMNRSTAQMAFHNGIQTLISTLVMISEESAELNLTFVYL
jgi:hypothetical protein